MKRGNNESINYILLEFRLLMKSTRNFEQMAFSGIENIKVLVVCTNNPRNSKRFF